MSDTTVYFVANLTIEDREEYLKYEKGFFPILKKHGGEFITYDDKPETFEGNNGLEGRVVMFKFPSEKLAKGWYNDPAYQAISEHRRSSTTINFFTMVHGLSV
ncbi:MAG: DUF1330 domain-containing protein [Halioglobus sp.]